MYDCHDIKSVYSAKIYAGSEAHLTFQSRYSLFPLFLSFFCYYSFSCTDVFRSSVVLWRTLPIRSFPNQNYYSSSAVLNNGVRVLVRDCSISLNDRVNAPRWRILSTLNLSALCIGIKLNLNALCIGIKLISIHNIKLRSQDSFALPISLYWIPRIEMLCNLIGPSISRYFGIRQNRQNSQFSVISQYRELM